MNNSIFIFKNDKKIDLRDFIDYTDKKTINLLSSANYLLGVFQLSSKVSMTYLKQMFAILQNDNDLSEFKVIQRLSDITTMIRPSCQESNAPIRYKDRLLGKEVETPIASKSIFFPIVSSVTQKTLLELIYQEQIMELLEKIFDVSAGKADTMRRAFEKKDSKKLNEFKKLFWDIWKNKATKEECKEFWEYLLSVSGYLFNLSHAVSYSYNTFQTAYIKTYPAYLLSIIMNHFSTDPVKMKQCLAEAIHRNINVHIPKFNNCYTQVTASEDQQDIYLSLNMLKGIGETVAKKISKKNDFKTLDDFLHYCSKNGINKTAIMTLIKIGFFDDIFAQEQLKDSKEANYMPIRAMICNYINEFKTFEDREEPKKYIKKYSSWIYKEKKGEEIIQDKEMSVTVRTYKKVWDLDEYIVKNKNSIINDFLTQLELLSVPILSLDNIYKEHYLEEVDEDVIQKIILIESVRNANKGNYVYSIITDIEGQTYFLSSKHLSYDKGFVLRIIYKEGDRGNKLINYTQIDYIR